MGIDAILTIVALVLSAASVVITGLFSIRTARLASELDAEREERMETQSAIKAAERVYGPLAQAAAELMLTWETVTDTGTRIPHVMGYASFSKRFRDDQDFRGWFTPVDSGMELVARGDHRRLIEIQHALVALIDALDPKRKYAVGYDLAPIELGPLTSTTEA